jgi:hypothetical protein
VHPVGSFDSEKNKAITSQTIIAIILVLNRHPAVRILKIL